MSLQVKPGSSVPEETARVARAAFPNGNPYMTLRDELETICADSLFTRLFPKRGNQRNRRDDWSW
jgi:transposase